MKTLFKLQPVLVVASVAIYVALAGHLDGETGGYLAKKFMKESGGSSPHAEILEIAVRWAVIMILITLGAGVLAFNLTNPGSDKSKLVCRIVSTVSLVGLNLVVWQRIVAIIMDIFGPRNIARTEATLFLTVVLAVLLLASNVVVCVGLIYPTECNTHASDLELAVARRTRNFAIQNTSRIEEPSTPPYIPNLFSNYLPECEICSMDFNSWRTQKPLSFDEEDSLDDCYETVLDKRGEGSENPVKRLQIMKAAAPRDAPVPEIVGLGNRPFVENIQTSNKAMDRHTEGFFQSLSPLSLWKRICEEGEFEYSVWMKASATVSLILLVHSCIRSICYFQMLASDWRLLVQTFEMPSVRGGFASEPLVRMNDVHLHIGPESLRDILPHKHGDGPLNESKDHNELVVFNKELEGTQGLIAVQSKMLIRVLQYTDSVVDKYRYTVIIGYIFSSLVALYGLFMVFANHKKLVLELEFRQSNACQGKACVQKFWDRSNPTYSTSGAVYFLGTLVSTTIIQQHILGVFVSLILAMAVNVANTGRLIDLLGEQSFILFALFLVTIPVTRFLGNHRLSDGLHLHYPVWFFLFMFLFSILNFVWGIFIGLYRLAVLLVSMFLAVNRLDSDKYQSRQGVDIGHNTFMSMGLFSDHMQQFTFEPQQNKAQEVRAPSDEI